MKNSVIITGIFASLFLASCNTDTATSNDPAKVTVKLTDGQIKGYVLPQEAKALVHVIKATDTIATALPNPDGFYMFRGIPANTYDVSYDADNTTGYLDQNKTNVSVVYGQVNNLGTTTLIK